MSKEVVKKFKTFSKLNEIINLKLKNELEDIWDNYLKLADIIDGIISEEGELSTRYWKNGVEDELYDILDSVKIVGDILDNKQRIINNFNMLMDGLDGWKSEGKSLSRYGSLSKINKSLFKK